MKKTIILYALCAFVGNMYAQSARELTKERVFEVLEDEMKNASQAMKLLNLNSDSCFVDFTVSQSAWSSVMTVKGGDTRIYEGKQADKCKASVTMTGNVVLTEDSKTSIGSQMFICGNYDDLREQIRISLDTSLQSLIKMEKKKRDSTLVDRFMSMPASVNMGESAMSRPVPFEQMKRLSGIIHDEIAKYSEFQNDTVCVTMHKSDLYRLTSECQKIFVSECYYTIDIALYYKQSGGEKAERHISTVHISEQDLKDRTEIVKNSIIRHMGDIVASRHAKNVDTSIEYEGPVLFEGETVWPSLFDSYVAEKSLASHRGRNKYDIGQNVCHPSVSISQLGDMSLYQGKELLGHYNVDADGQKAQNLLLVENGTLTAKLGGRIITDNKVQPTGNMRFSTYLMATSLRYGVLCATVSNPKSNADIRKHFMEEAKKKGLAKAYIIRSSYGFSVLVEVDIATSKETVLTASYRTKSHNMSDDDEFSRECYIIETNSSGSMSSLIFPETMLAKRVHMVIGPKAALRN